MEIEIHTPRGLTDEEGQVMGLALSAIAGAEEGTVAAVARALVEAVGKDEAESALMDAIDSQRNLEAILSRRGRNGPAGHGLQALARALVFYAAQVVQDENDPPTPPNPLPTCRG